MHNLKSSDIIIIEGGRGMINRDFNIMHDTLLRTNKILQEINEELDSLNNIESKLISNKKCECKHAKKEEDEVLSIFSDLIDDLDHVTIFKVEH